MCVYHSIGRNMDARAVELDRYRLLTESSEHAYSNHSVVHTTKSGHSVKWKRRKEVGVGSFGVTWLEEDEVGELRAVKCLPRTTLKMDFMREVHILAELRGHPDHFIRFSGWFEDSQTTFIAMEYTECGDLGAYMKYSRPKARREAREITQQILKGLVILHGKSICHRDLKPQNIFIASFSPIWVKIADFGISKREIGTQLRTHCGTPGYRAPEQHGILPLSTMLGRTYTTAADLWALGSIVHEILTSEIPFRYDEADLGTAISGFGEIGQLIDPLLLFQYCAGSIEFPTQCLEDSVIGTQEIGLVKRLMIANPRCRMSASEALKSPWLLEENDSETLRNQFSRQGAQISLETADHLIAHRQVGMAYIMQALPDSTEESITAIWHAGASNGSLFLAKSLLRAIDNIDVMINGVTALQAAAMGGHFDIVKLLLTTGADVNAEQSTYNRTALQEAAKVGQAHIVKLLMSAGADLDNEELDFDEDTSLSLCSSSISTSDSLFSRFSGVSSNSSLHVSLHVLPQNILKKVENDIAKVLVEGAKVSMIIAKALQSQNSSIVDRQLSRALKEFSNQVNNLATTKELSRDEVTILLNIRSKSALDTISKKIREFSMPKPSIPKPSDNAVNFQNLQHQGQFPKQLMVATFLQSEPELSDILNTVDKVGIPSDPGNSADWSESEDSHDSSDSEDDRGRLEVVKFDHSLAKVLDYLKSENVIKRFEDAVIKRFLPGRQGHSGTKVSIDTRGGEINSTKEAARLKDEIDNEILEKYLPPHQTEAPHGVPDLITSPTLRMDRDHSWPVRFENGKTNISFSTTCRWSLINEVKGWLEGLIQEPINWWPLGPRRHPLPEDCVWVNWECRCGKRLFSVISRERIDQYNQWLSLSNGSSPSPSHHPAPATTQTQSGAAAGSNPAPGKAPPPPPTSVCGTTLTTPTTPTAAGRVNVPNRQLVWCVNSGPRLTRATSIDVSSSDDATIFRKLKTEYWKIRGWRGWLSPYTISDIKFVKFRPYRPGRVSCYNGESLPKRDSPYYNFYDYTPKPPGEVPPVPVELLMEFFDSPSCAGNCSDSLKAFPKRTNGEMCPKESHGWGLRACEQLAFSRTLVLSFIFLAYPIWFFINWLRHHPGDLQNASIPLFLALALIQTYIIVPRYFA